MSDCVCNLHHPPGWLLILSIEEVDLFVHFDLDNAFMGVVTEFIVHLDGGRLIASYDSDE